MSQSRTSTLAAVAALLLAAPAGAAAPDTDELPAVRVARADQVIDAGTFDVASGRLLAPTTTEAAGVAGTVIFDNTDLSPFFLLGVDTSHVFDNGILAAGGDNAVTRIRVAYGTSTAGPIDLTLRLHEGVLDPDSEDGEGLETDAGAGIIVPLLGLPGAPVDGVTVVAEVDIAMPGPIRLPDGPIRVSIQSEDGDTGPCLVYPDFATWGTRNRLDMFALDGNYLTQFQLFEDEAQTIGISSLYLRLTGVPDTFEASSGIDAALTSRDRFEGVIETAGDKDVLRFSALAAEEVTITLKADRKSDLMPRLELVDDFTGEVIETSAGSSKLKVKKLPMPRTGTYRLCVDGMNETTGGYRLKFKGKVARSSKKPEDLGEQAPGGVLASFEVKAGAQLTAKVKPADKTSEPVGAPVLMGPLGEMDLGEYLSVKKGNRYKLKKVPLDATGTWSLIAGASEAGVVQEAKVRLKLGKGERDKHDEFEKELVGTWLRHEYVRDDQSQRYVFEPGRGGPGELITVSGGQASRLRIAKWSLELLESQPGARLLSYTTRPPLLVQPAGSITVIEQDEPSKDITAVLRHPMGDPNLIENVNTGERFRRDPTRIPEAPSVDGLVTVPAPGLGDGGDTTRAALQIGCLDGAATYEIFRAGPGQELPAFPYDVIGAECKGGTLTWIDLGSRTDEGFVPSTYWVRAVDREGNRSPAGGPVSVN